jgi:methylmalonyl-CoA/ethylmalonyl-CoA epimerase
MADVHDILKDYIIEAAHIGFVVPDLELAINQAARVYGLSDNDISYQPEPGEEALTRFAFFSVGGLSFEYIQPCSDHFRQLLLAMPSGGGGINHIAWRVSDIDRVLEVLASRGIFPGHVTPDGVVVIGTKKMVYLDPVSTGGSVIELLEYQAEGDGVDA